MAEHGSVRHQAAVLENRPQQEPIIGMTDGPVTGIGIVHEKHVPLFDRAVVRLLETVNEAAELTNDHFAVEICDHRKGIALLADTGRHGRAEQHRVHLPARVQHRILDNIERDRIQIDRLKRFGFRLYYCCWHFYQLRLSVRCDQKVAEGVYFRHVPRQYYCR